MFIRIFRSGYTIKVTMFFIIAFLLWIPAFINLPAPVTQSTYGIAYDFLFSYFQPGAILSTVIAFVLLLFQYSMPCWFPSHCFPDRFFCLP